LYEYVAKSIEYCAIEIGYGGWIPHSPGEVQKVRYGDCKDKANYLRTLLLEAGIDSQIAIVHSHHGFPNELVLPSLAGTFNHAILAVNLPGGKQVFADPTERTVPFGLLPARDCESPALLLSAEGERLTHTPSFGPERNTELQRFSLKIDDTGRAVGTFAISSTGVNAAQLKYELLRGTNTKEDRIQDWLNLRHLHVNALTRIDAPDFADRALVEGRLEAERLIAMGAEVSLIRLDEFAPRLFPSFNEERRQTPYAYRWTDIVAGELELTMPTGARATAVPTATVLDNPFFHYELRWVNGGDQVSVHRRLIHKQRVIAAKEFTDFREAVTQVQIAEARAVVVRFEKGGAR
jgi:hypothetical protein